MMTRRLLFSAALGALTGLLLPWKRRTAGAPTPPLLPAESHCVECGAPGADSVVYTELKRTADGYPVFDPATRVYPARGRVCEACANEYACGQKVNKWRHTDWRVMVSAEEMRDHPEAVRAFLEERGATKHLWEDPATGAHYFGAA